MYLLSFYNSTRVSGYDRSTDVVETKKQRIDDYSMSKRDDYKRNDQSFKRSNDYSKREPDPPIRPSYDNRSRDTMQSVVGKDPRYSDSSNFRDDRDSRQDKSKQFYKHDSSNDKSNQYYGNGSGGGGSGSGSGGHRVHNSMMSSTSTSNGGKQRYDNQSHMQDNRYQDNRQTSSGNWYGSSNTGGGQSQNSKSFMPQSSSSSSSNNWPLKQQQPDGNWGRNMDSNQDRYDRTYNERRTPQYSDSQRPSSFVGGRPQERGYGGGGRF